MSFKENNPTCTIDYDKVLTTVKETVTAEIDSLNLTSPILGSIFIHDGNYRIESLKKAGKTNDKNHIDLFGKSMFNTTPSGNKVCPFIEIDAIHAGARVYFPLKVHARKKNSPTVEFAGLHRYDHRSQQLREILFQMYEKFQDTFIQRMDICIDFDNTFPEEVDKILLSKKRIPTRHIHTTYYKTPKEGKSNNYINILVYNKGKKENTTFTKEIIRLEFQFKGSFFKGIKFKDLDKALLKIEKTINRHTGLTIKVNSPYSKSIDKKPQEVTRPDITSMLMKDKESQSNYLKDMQNNSEKTLKMALEVEETFLYMSLKNEDNSLVKFLEKNSYLYNEPKNIIIKAEEPNDPNISHQLDTIKDSLENEFISLHKKITTLGASRKKKNNIPNGYHSTKEASEFLGVNPSFLTKRMETDKKKGVFKENIHYFKPTGETILRWDVEKLDNWLRGTREDVSQKDTELENLLKRR